MSIGAVAVTIGIGTPQQLKHRRGLSSRRCPLEKPCSTGTSAESGAGAFVVDQPGDRVI
jgi:hypothetical protein